MNTNRTDARPLRVGWDLDEVVYPFIDTFGLYLRSQGHPTNRMPSATRWEFHRGWGLTDEQFAQACHDGVDAGVIFRAGKPLDGAAGAMARITALGARIDIVTNRFWGSPGVAERATRAWLAEHRLPFTTLTFSPDKIAVPTDVFIEDNLGDYDALDSAGVEVYLLDRPWNRVDGDTRRRVPDLRRFADTVVLMANRPQGLPAARTGSTRTYMGRHRLIGR